MLYTSDWFKISLSYAGSNYYYSLDLPRPVFIPANMLYNSKSCQRYFARVWSMSQYDKVYVHTDWHVNKDNVILLTLGSCLGLSIVRNAARPSDNTAANPPNKILYSIWLRYILQSPIVDSIWEKIWRNNNELMIMWTQWKNNNVLMIL